MELKDFNWQEFLTKEEFSLQDFAPALNHLNECGYPSDTHLLEPVEEDFCFEVDAMHDFLTKINYWNQPNHMLLSEDNPNNRDHMIKVYTELFAESKIEAKRLLEYLQLTQDDFGPEYDDNIEHEVFPNT